MMKVRKIAAPLLAFLPIVCLAGDGLVAPAIETLWPQWHARIAVQTAAVSPLSYSQWGIGPGSVRSLQGGALLGDFHFASPGLWTLRASGGLMVGATGGAPMVSAVAGPRLGLSVQAVPLAPTGAGESAGTAPYLGLGLSGSLWRDTLAVTADVGLVAGGSLGRAMLGNQGMERSLRELRLAPVMQLGLRYVF